LSRHQQEVTGGQLVTMSLVSGTVDSDVALECHLCCPPPLPRKEVSSLDSSWGLCASRLNWRKGKQKSCGCPCLFPLLRGTEWELGWGDYRARDMLYMCVSRTAMCVRVRWGVTWGHVDFLSFFLKFVCLVAIFEVESKRTGNGTEQTPMRFGNWIFEKHTLIEVVSRRLRMGAERPGKKEKWYLNCMSSKSQLSWPILLLLVINSDQPWQILL